MPDSDIQHTQTVLGMAILFAMLGTLLLSLVGRWIGGAWTVLLAILLASLVAYQPLCNSPLFGRLATDRQQRILLAAIPFTLLLIGLSFKRIPLLLRVISAIVGPAMMLTWVFYGYDKTVPMMTIFTTRIAPICLSLFVVWLLIEPIAIRTPGAAAPMILGFLGAGCGFLLMLSAENQAGLMGLMVPATAGGATLAAIVAAMFRKQLSAARGPVLLWLTLLASQFAYLWIAHSTKEMPLNYLTWLAAVPLLAWIPEIGPIHRIKPWKRETLRFVLLAIPVVITMVAAKKQHDREAAEAGDPFGILWQSPQFVPHSAAPMCPRYMPMPKTINPPTIT
jgi:hypothetical protein